MSYFEDNEDRIIYGPKLHGVGEAFASKPYYTKKDGTVQFLDEMSDSHLRNALALAERKGLQGYISMFKEEVLRRQKSTKQH